MLPSERQNKFLELLSQKDVVTILEFSKEFQVSIETVRRDLSILEKSGKIQKVYGGAKLKDLNFSEPSMESRMNTKLSQKDAIGKKCSEFINDGDCIFINSGSTPHHIAKNLSDKKNLLIITNSLLVANELINTDFEIIIIGGSVRHSERSIVSYNYLFNFSELNIQKSFLGAGGITAKNGISDFDMQEAVTRKHILERSKEVFIVADSSKFGKDVTINIAPIDAIDYIVTDSFLDKNLQKTFEENMLIVAEV